MPNAWLPVPHFEQSRDGYCFSFRFPADPDIAGRLAGRAYSSAVEPSAHNR